MDWDWLNIIGVVAFATSGAIVAMEEGYDLLGVIFLGLATSFGGGVLRSVLLGQPVTALWTQKGLLLVASLAMFVVFVTPRRWLARWQPLEVVFDAMGLAPFEARGVKCFALKRQGDKARVPGVRVATMHRVKG